MSKSYGPNDQLSVLCTLDGVEGDHWLVRKGKKNSRVLKVGDAGEGTLVDTTKITKEWPTLMPENPASTPVVAAS